MRYLQAVKDAMLELFPSTDSTPQTIPLQDGELIYFPQWLSPEKAQQHFDTLHRSLDWKAEEIVMFGKMVMQPRLMAWYGDQGTSYTYSGLTVAPSPWTKLLGDIKNAIQQAVPPYTFNSVLCNLYRNGQDSMGWHSDNEPELGKNPVIASLSLGGVRRFHLRHKKQKDLPRVRLDLKSGSLLIMAGETQHFWQHQVSKTKKAVEPRINLTFRLIRGYRGIGD